MACLVSAARFSDHIIPIILRSLHWLSSGTSEDHFQDRSPCVEIYPWLGLCASSFFAVRVLCRASYRVL